MADKWLKFAITFCDDEKIKIIRAHEGCDTFIWLWLWLLTTAMKKETDTLYIVAGLPYEPETIARAADVKIDAVNRGMDLFIKLQMVQIKEDGGICINNFHKHQAIAEMQHKRKLAAERKRKQREKEAAQIAYTPENVTRDTCDSHATEKRREDEESDEEEKIKILPKKPAGPLPGNCQVLVDSSKQTRDTVAKDALWNAWQEEYQKAFKKKYVPTAGDWKQIKDREIYDIEPHRIAQLVHAWFNVPAKEKKYFHPYLKSFACGWEKAEEFIQSTKSSKDDFNKISGWDGK